MVGSALQDKKIVINGGDQWRPFLHVDDAAQAFTFAVENKIEGIYNVIWKNITINQIAKDIKKLIPTKVKISKDIVDKRDYRVSGAKLDRFDFKAKKDIKHATKEFKEKIQTEVNNFKQNEFSNYKSFFNSKSIQRKVYTRGPIFK